MHNTKPTHGTKNIDVLVSDMAHLYSTSTIIPNVLTDIADGQPGGGKRSDHPVVYCEPQSDFIKKPTRQVEVKKTRRMDDRRKYELANWIQQESWEEFFDGNSASVWQSNCSKSWKEILKKYVQLKR